MLNQVRSIFSIRKKEDQKPIQNSSPVPNRSVAPNVSYAPIIKQQTQKATPLTTNQLYTDPLSRFGNQIVSGNGLNAIQGLFSTPKVSTQPQQPKQQTQKATPLTTNQLYTDPLSRFGNQIVSGNGLNAIQGLFSTPKVSTQPQQPKQQTQKATPLTTNQLYTDPLSRFGNQIVSGNGLNAIQGLFNIPKLPTQTRQQSTTNMSVAPKIIQGSGFGPQYENNLNNRKQTTLSAPPTLKTNTSDQEIQSDPNTTWLDYIQNANNKQKQLAQLSGQSTIDFLRNQGQLNNQYLLDQIPIAQDRFEQLKSNTEATIEDLIKGGEMQKSQTEDYYGDAQRQLAQALRETQGRQRREFASLGSLDSFGEGSYLEANTNAESEFNRNVAQLQRDKANKMSEIEMSVRNAERNARQTIIQEEQKLQQLKRDIQYAIANNDLETAQGLKQAYLQTQQLIYDIEDALAQTKYQFALEQQKLKNEMALTNKYARLMQTGQPTNDAEFEFYIKNKQAIDEMFGGGKKAGEGKVLRMIDKLLSFDTTPITGFNRIVIPGTSAYEIRETWEGLKSLLTLAERGQLKGSGAVSDFETKILEKAAAAGLSPKMNDSAFRARLMEIRNELANGQNNIEPNQILRVRENKTGRTGTIQASEFDPLLYTRI
jgi:hypothetical protein